MTTSPQTATLLPMTVPFSERLSETWLLVCYYHEVTCPSGVYCLEFFGPRMDERGYKVKEAA